MLWSLIFVGGAVVILRRTGWLRELRRHKRDWGILVLAGVLNTANWGIYIYGVNTNRVVEASLGYFINPLLVVAVGVVLLRERLKIAQWVAVAIGGYAMVVLTIEYGRIPWIAVSLAGTFMFYGLLKKQTTAPVLEGFVAENLVVLPIVLVYLGWLQWSGGTTFGSISWSHTLLMIGAGLVGSTPMLLFALSAQRIKLSTLGLLQYIEPSLQFGLGVLLFREAMSEMRWFGFVLVWSALLILILEGVSRHPYIRRRLRAGLKRGARAAANVRAVGELYFPARRRNYRGYFAADA